MKIFISDGGRLGNQIAYKLFIDALSLNAERSIFFLSYLPFKPIGKKIISLSANDRNFFDVIVINILFTVYAFPIRSAVRILEKFIIAIFDIKPLSMQEIDFLEQKRGVFCIRDIREASKKFYQENFNKIGVKSKWDIPKSKAGKKLKIIFHWRGTDYMTWRDGRFYFSFDQFLERASIVLSKLDCELDAEILSDEILSDRQRCQLRHFGIREQFGSSIGHAIISLSTADLVVGSVSTFSSSICQLKDIAMIFLTPDDDVFVEGKSALMAFYGITGRE